MPSAKGERQKVLVIEPRCRLGWDHYYTTTRFITDSLPDTIRTVVINREAEPDLEFDPEVIVHDWHDDRSLLGRLFPRARASTGYRNRQAARNAAMISRLVDEAGLGPDDTLIIHSATAILAHALALAMHDADERRWPNTHVRFLSTGLPDNSASEALHIEPLGQLSRSFAKLHIYTETAEMAASLMDKYGYGNVGEWLLPMTFLPSTQALPKRSPEQGLVIGFLGGKRPEQGLTKIPAILRELSMEMQRCSLGPVSVVVQHPSQGRFERMDQTQKRALEEIHECSGLHEDLRVEWCDPLLDADTFRAAISRLHMQVLPYDVSVYRDKGSGLIIECFLAGIPVIAPEGFAMRNWQQMAGTPTAGTPTEYGKAIVEIARNHARHVKGAEAAGKAMREHMLARVEALVSRAG